MNKITSFLLFLSVLTVTFAQAQHQIIPTPRSYEVSDGELLINEGFEFYLKVRN